MHNACETCKVGPREVLPRCGQEPRPRPPPSTCMSEERDSYDAYAPPSSPVVRPHSLRCVTTLSGHHSGIRAIAIRFNKIFTGGYDNTIKVWNLDSGNCEVRTPVRAAAAAATAAAAAAAAAALPPTCMHARTCSASACSGLAGHFGGA